MPDMGVDILHVDINSTFDDPTNDVIYVKSKDGKVFSNSLFQSNWQEVDPVPSEEKDLDKCATDWVEADRPPVGNNVVDSAGVRIERPSNLILRCYVLLDDGSLQAWVYYISSLGFMGVAMARSLYILPGAVIGVILGYFVVRLINKRISSVKAENAS